MFVALVFLSFAMGAAPARGETATFIEPAAMAEPDRTALSTQGDGAGYLIALGESLQFVFDAPLNLSQGDRVSVFTLPPTQGQAFATIRFGAYNGGSPVVLATRNIRAGQSRSINISGGLLSGCQLLGGCDYIEIVTTRTRRGAAGVEVDYVTIDGRVVEVTSAAPEPTSWALMIVAFAGVAARLKARRRRALMRPPRPAFPTASRSPPWRATTAPRTVHP